MNLEVDFIKRFRWSLLIFVILVVATVILCVLAAIHSNFPGDEVVLRKFQEFENPRLTIAARTVTILGDKEIVVTSVLAVAGILWAVGRRRESIAALLLLVSESLGLLSKALIDRPRPEFILFPPGSDTGAFPSGHAIHAILFFGFLMFLVMNNTKSRSLKIGVLITLPLIILSVGVSRIYLGFHWPSDVLGGYIFGSVCLWILLWAVNLCKREFVAMR